MKNSAATFLTVCLASTVVGSWASVAKPTCGGSTSSKDILLVNPKNPPRECIYRISATSSYVCQLRIDFSYTLAQPSVPTVENGLPYVECRDDYFQVGDLRLCGSESGQHIYVPFNRTAGVTKVDLQFVLAARVGGYHGLPTPSWSMSVKQLECPAGAAIRGMDLEPMDFEPADLESLDFKPLQPEARSAIKDGFFVAPPGCLQYFPHTTGAVKSFNFVNGNGRYPGRLNYAICFRRTTSTKALELTFGDFELGADSVFNSLDLDNYCYAQLHTEGVNEDFLLIPQSIVKDNNIRASYFCGDSIRGRTVVSTNPGPLMMVFNSDAVYKMQREVGFAFTYRVL